MTSDSTLAMSAPELSSSDTTATGTTLNWTAVSGATSYTVYLEDGTVVGVVAAGTTTLDITGLTQGTDYTYYVVATDGTNSTTSNHVTVSTLDTEAPVPTGSGAVIANNPKYTTLDVSWPMATDNVTAQGSLTYLLYYSKNSTSVSTIEEMETNGIPGGAIEPLSVGYGISAVALSKTLTGLTPSTTYYANIIVEDAAGNKTAYTLGSGATLTPEAVTLNNNNVTQTSAVLNWNAEPGATLYQIYDGSGTLVETVAAPTTTFFLTGLTPHTTYRFTVMAMDGVTLLATSNITSFTTLGSNPVPNPQTGDPSRMSEWLGILWDWIF
jgi:hypothetical protein